jgi:hypothetical protein
MTAPPATSKIAPVTYDDSSEARKRAPRATSSGVNHRWPAIMSSLKSLLETGEPITFSAP